MDEEEEMQVKDKLKVELVGQPKINIHHTRKSSFPYKKGGPEVEVNFTTKVNNVPMTCKFTDISVEIKPKDAESKITVDDNHDSNNAKNNVNLAAANIGSKPTLASRFILPNAGLLANPLTTLMTAMPAVVTTGTASPVTNLLSQASPFYYLIKMKPPTENVVNVQQKRNGSGVETVAVPSPTANYVYAMPVASTTINPQSPLAVIPQAVVASPAVLPVIPNYSFVDSKEGIATSTVAMTTESNVGLTQPCVIAMSAEEVNKTVCLNSVVNMDEDNKSSTGNKKMSLLGSSIKKPEDFTVDTDSFKIDNIKTEDIDDSDMSLGAQLLLNLSNQNVHHRPAAETFANPPQTKPVATAIEKPCLAGNSQFQFRNLIYQVSKPIKMEPADHYSEVSTDGDVSMSVKQEQPEQEVFIPPRTSVSISEMERLRTESKPDETRFFSYHGSLAATGGNLPHVSNHKLPQSVSQMIQENALANQNLSHTISQAEAKIVSKKNASNSPKIRGVGNRQHHSYSQTNYDDSGDDVSAEHGDPDKNPQYIDWEKAKKAIEEEKLKAALRMSPSQMKSKHLSMHSKKPIRPVDRQKMGPWLKNLLDNETCPGLVWVDRSHKVFQVSWRHRARMGWDMKLDGDVFERWARHTGIYCDGDPPEPRRWKTNFRAALHSMSDVEELPGIRKGRYAYRRYYFRDFEEFDNMGMSIEAGTKKAKKEDKSKLSSPATVADDEVTPQATTTGSPRTTATSINSLATSTNNSIDGQVGHIEYIRVPLPSKKTAIQEQPDKIKIKLVMHDGSSPNLTNSSHVNAMSLLTTSQQMAAQSAAARSPLTSTALGDDPTDTSLTDADAVKEENSDVESTSSVELAEDVLDRPENHEQSSYIPTDSSVKSFNIPTQEILGPLHTAETNVSPGNSMVSKPSVVFTPTVLPVSSVRTIPATDNSPTPIRIIHTTVDPIPFSVGVVPTTVVSVPTSLGRIQSVVPSQSCVRPGPSSVGSSPSSYGSILSSVKSLEENKQEKTIRLLPGKRKRKKSEDSGSQEMKPFCTFCEKLVRNLSTHLDRKHRKETAVAEALSFLSYLRSKTVETSDDVDEEPEECDSREESK